MSNAIPSEISREEILAHFIYDRSFKNKKISADKLETKNLFLENKGGVSLQRQFYCSETTCKFFAKKVAGARRYVGFIVFRKSAFDTVKKKYRESRADFEAEIKATPLDENNKYRISYQNLTTDTPGNPAHADLIYINPAQIEVENPNTAMRSFSKKLAKVCELIIDEQPEDDEYSGVMFDQKV